MIVVSNRLQVAKGHEADFEKRFEGRARLVENMPGFVRLEILRPVKSDYYIVLTHWQDEASFQAWTNSAEFKEAFTESVVEDVTLAWVERPGYAVKHGPEIVPGKLLAEQVAPDAKNATTEFKGNVQKMHIASNDGNSFLMGKSSMSTVTRMNSENGLATTEDCSVVRN